MAKEIDIQQPLQYEVVTQRTFDDAYWLRYFAGQAMAGDWASGEDACGDTEAYVRSAQRLLAEIKRVKDEK